MVFAEGASASGVMSITLWTMAVFVERVRLRESLLGMTRTR